jgi:hypothetical protein
LEKGKAGSCILCVSLDPFQAELVRQKRFLRPENRKKIGFLKKILPNLLTN